LGLNLILLVLRLVGRNGILFVGLSTIDKQRHLRSVSYRHIRGLVDGLASIVACALLLFGVVLRKAARAVAGLLRRRGRAEARALGLVVVYGSDERVCGLLMYCWAYCW